MRRDPRKIKGRSFLMPHQRIEVLGLGNSLVDLFAHIEEDFLVAESMQKAAMILIDEERAEQLYRRMGPATIVSGGSAANTIAGVRSLGVASAYIGKVKDDELGRAF